MSEAGFEVKFGSRRGPILVVDYKSSNLLHFHNSPSFFSIHLSKIISSFLIISSSIIGLPSSSYIIIIHLHHQSLALFIINNNCFSSCALHLPSCAAPFYHVHNNFSTRLLPLRIESDDQQTSLAHLGYRVSSSSSSSVNHLPLSSQTINIKISSQRSFTSHHGKSFAHIYQVFTFSHTMRRHFGQLSISHGLFTLTARSSLHATHQDAICLRIANNFPKSESFHFF